MTPHHPTGPRSGFTLVEMIVSLSIVGVILVATGSVLVLGARATTITAAGPATRAAAARTAVETVADDLAIATEVLDPTATAVTLRVPDRTGDGVAETIRYAWSGVAGAPLTRQVNGGAAHPIAADVRGFDLSYLTRTVGPPPPVESAEMAFVAHDGGAGPTTQDFTLAANTWPAESFKVNFPANTLSWRVTRVLVQMKGAGTNGKLGIELRYADGSNKPAATVIDSASVNTSAVPATATWVEFTFTNACALDPDRGLSVVVKPTLAGAGSVRYHNASIDTAIHYTTTSNSGGSWAAPATATAMQVYVYGTITTQD